MKSGKRHLNYLKMLKEYFGKYGKQPQNNCWIVLIKDKHNKIGLCGIYLLI